MMRWNSVSSTDSASSVKLGVSGEHRPLRMARCKSACKRWRSAGAFSTVWNSLPDKLRDPACGSDSFKQFLKTILFSLH